MRYLYSFLILSLWNWWIFYTYSRSISLIQPEDTSKRFPHPGCSFWDRFSGLCCSAFIVQDSFYKKVILGKKIVMAILIPCKRQLRISTNYDIPVIDSGDKCLQIWIKSVKYLTFMKKIRDCGTLFLSFTTIISCLHSHDKFLCFSSFPWDCCADSISTALPTVCGTGWECLCLL